MQGGQHLRPVDIGGEAKGDGGVERPQRLPDQPGAEVGAADADVDDGGEALARAPRTSPERMASASTFMRARVTSTSLDTSSPLAA